RHSENTLLMSSLCIVYCYLLCFSYCCGVLLELHSFPPRRSSDLFRGRSDAGRRDRHQQGTGDGGCRRDDPRDPGRGHLPGRHETDRKSTRLNSSHVKISYAVFCLKKKILQL